MAAISLKNAVAYKDMSIKAKRKGLALRIFIFNLIMFIVTMILLLVYNSQLATHNLVPASVFTTGYNVIIIVECALICLVIPSVTAPAIANERERQTLDVLLTTSMSYFDIILGKFASALAYVVIIVISTIPFLSLSLVYGGISLIQMLAIFLTMIVTAVYFTAIGIFFSTIARKTSSANILTLFSLFILIFGTLILTTIIVSFANSINDANYEAVFVLKTRRPLNADWAFFLLYLNPASIVYDALDKIVGLISSGVGEGMDLFINSYAVKLSSSNILIKYWAIFASVTELVLSYFILKFAAKKLDPTKRACHVRKKAAD